MNTIERKMYAVIFHEVGAELLGLEVDSTEAFTSLTDAMERRNELEADFFKGNSRLIGEKEAWRILRDELHVIVKEITVIFH